MKKSRFRWALPALVMLGLSGVVHGQAVPSQAMTNVTLHFADGTSVPKATILWRNGSIEAAGTSVTIPFDAKVLDGGDSLHVYPGWVDGMAEWGMPEISRDRTPVPRPGYPGYERAGIQPNRSASDLVVENTRDFADWRKLGFTSAAVAPRGFMLPGSVDLMSLTTSGSSDGAKLVIPGIGQRAAIQGAPGVNPSTTMGVMARFRQLMYDAEALKTNQRLFASNSTAYQSPEHDEVLAALWPVMEGNQTLFFSANNPEEIRRVIKLKDEFGFNMILVSGNQAGMIASELIAAKIPVLASINIESKPEAMTRASNDSVKAVTRTEEHRLHDIRQEEAWKMEAGNIKTLMDAGVKVGFSGAGLRSADFQAKVKLLIESGLTEAQIVQLFSTNTAQIIGHGNLLGDLKKGMLAGFGVYTAPISDAKSKMLYSVASGDLKYYPIPATPAGRGNAQRSAGPRGANQNGDN